MLGTESQIRIRHLINFTTKPNLETMYVKRLKFWIYRVHITRPSDWLYTKKALDFRNIHTGFAGATGKSHILCVVDICVDRKYYHPDSIHYCIKLLSCLHYYFFPLLRAICWNKLIKLEKQCHNSEKFESTLKMLFT